MGQQGQVEGFERRVEQGSANDYVKVDTGGDTDEAQHFNPSGEDSPPIAGDVAALVEHEDGTKQAVAYHDPKSEQTSLPGEKRFYSRTEQGQKIAEIYMSHGELRIEVLDPNVPIRFKTPGKWVVESPDVNLGGEGGRGVVCVGDIGMGSVRALCGAPGSPIIPVPPATPTPTGGVPVAVQMVSGRVKVTARDGG